MANKPAETEERLRSWLDTNQAARERLCMALLGLDRRFSNVRPRHPKGGRDGGCDIEAIYKETEKATVAVAFKNGANDSAAQKKSIEAKFDDDAKKGRLAEPQPSMFVFFTNLAFTVREKEALKKKALKQGYADCEIMDRERMRLALDNTDGLGARLQFLDIAMSHAEQASFFARWGDDIQSLVASRFQSVETTLARIMFLQEARGALSAIHIRLVLDRTYQAAEIGHFRAFASFFLPRMRHRMHRVLFGSSDNSRRFQPHPYRGYPEPPGIAHGISGAVWESKLLLPGDPAYEDYEEDDDDKDRTDLKQGSTSSGAGLTELSVLPISYTHTHTFDFNFGPYLNLEDLDGAWTLIYLNASLAEKLAAVEIWANGYIIMSASLDDIRIDRTHTDFPIEGHFSDAELSDPWVRLRPSSLNSTFNLDFSGRTPRRVFSAKETSEPRRS